MKKTLIEELTPEVRPTSLGLLSIIKMNKSLAFSVAAIFIVATGIFGFSFGEFSSESSAAEMDYTDADIAFEADITNHELLCLEIETSDQQVRNEVLREENDTIKEETESVADTILDALMSNLENKKLASRSNSLNAYLQEASNLVQLNYKLQVFKKSDDYGLVDITEYEKALTTRLSYIPTLKPIPGSYGGYGSRIHPIYKYRQFHPAADQGAAKGTKIKAAASGYVVRASWQSSMGYNICINHGNGFVTTYMHNSKNLVVAGQKVKKGDIIGLVGSTGTATGPHLHFEVTYNGSPFNPQKILMQ
ncbi:MAG: peptidoglycan DD-metalloendopeptidase family protein [Saccharofermentanales bacterium]